MITFDDRNIKRFEKDLLRAKRHAFPHAIRGTLNSAAFEAQRETRSNIRSDLQVRNQWTERSIRVERVKGLRIDSMQSVTGSDAAYMRRQEFGGVRRSEGAQGVPIPTSYSAGLGRSTPRTRLPRRPNTLRQIQLKGRKGRNPRTAKQRTLLAVQQAVSTGHRVIFLELGRTRGIFRVTGGRKTFKSGWPTGAKLEMVWDMSRRTVSNSPTPTLGPAVDHVIPRMPVHYRAALLHQLKRHRLFR